MVQHDEAGVFTWNLANNTLFADSAVAKLFGLCPDATVAGLPLQAYVERIHAEDRADVAKSIHECVISGEASQQTYRVLGFNGRLTDVIVLGRCFRDASGDPCQYTGIVFPQVDLKQMGGGLIESCMRTYWLALESGRPDVAERLLEIIRDTKLEQAECNRRH
jgi:PAS domain-containing protein